MSTNPAEAASLPGGVLFIRRRPLPRHMSGRSWSGTPQDEPAVEGPWALVVVIFATQPVKDGASGSTVEQEGTQLQANEWISA
jgi:hypothetical protein